MFEIHSRAFAHDSPIPERYTCQGEDLSPPLEWSGAPPGTRTVVLLVEDPDAPDPAAPKRVWVHWLRYNIPSAIEALAEGEGNGKPTSGEEAITDGKSLGYHGPCPPIGRHRYYFRIFALDAVLPSLGPKATRKDVEQAMQGHVLESAVWMGTYAQA